MKVAVIATRIRSGGGIKHALALLKNHSSQATVFSHITVFASMELKTALGEINDISIELVPNFGLGLCGSIFWELLILPKVATKRDFDALLYLDAGSVVRSDRSIVICQDMLPFEPGERQRYHWLSIERLRLELLRKIHKWSMERATGVIFLCDYVAEFMTREMVINDYRVINHGMSQDFFSGFKRRNSEIILSREFRILVISEITPYKQQDNFLKAISLLKKRCANEIKVSLVGGGKPKYISKLKRYINDLGLRESVQILPFVSQAEVLRLHQLSDLFVYTSTCENFPITLLEAMASGVPLISSNRGPMPDILGDKAILFDPENPEETFAKLEWAIKNYATMVSNAGILRNRVSNLDWMKCVNATWAYVAYVGKNLDD